MPSAIYTYSNKKISWINITHPGKNQIKKLAKDFKFHELDLRDCLPPLQRPKVVSRKKYLFMILLFPVYNRQTREITATEVDFFISKKYIVTVHNNELLPLKEIKKIFDTDRKTKNNLLSNTPVRLLYEILSRLLQYCFPMLTHISNDIDELSDTIFDVHHPELVKNILIIKRNIVNFRKTMQAHKSIIKKLILLLPDFFSIKKFNFYYISLLEYTKEIWDSIENYHHSIEAVYQTHESLTSYRLNTIMKTLTIFSVIVFPLTLLAAIFGMNITAGMPFTNSPIGFWIVIGLMLAGTLLMITIFKLKKWL